MQTVLALFLWWMVPLLPEKVVAKRLSMAHPFHVSVTEINQNTAARTLEVQSKFFTDDFEATLKTVYNTKADLTEAALHEKMDTLVSRYLRSRLQLQINDKPVALQYLGFEQEKEAVYVYLEAVNIAASVQRVTCYSKLLYEQFADQVNIFHVTTAKGKKSTKLDNPAHLVQLDFE